MAGFREPEFARSQLILFSKSIDDAIPQDHGVRLFDQILRSKPFQEAWASMALDYKLIEGRPPYHPRVLGGLWLYGMANRIRSSRQLELACHNRIDFIWLMERETPDHGTISLFVKRHGRKLKELLRSTLKVAIQAGLLKAVQLAVDGSKVEASASNDSMKKRPALEAELQAVDTTLTKLTEEWEANEIKEAGMPESPWTPGCGKNEKASLERKRRR